MAELTWTCPQCTQTLPRTAAYCRWCGYAFRSRAPRPTTTAPVRPPPSPGWAGPAVAFALCALFACGIFAAVGLWAAVAGRPTAAPTAMPSASSVYQSAYVPASPPSPPYPARAVPSSPRR